MNKTPDYIGTWLVDGDKEHINVFGDLKYELLKLVFGHGRFTFFIDERKPLYNLTEMVKGRIYDSLGEASFEGEIIKGIGKDVIKFVKKYNKNIVDEGLTVDEIPYFAEGNINTGFFGQYFMKKSPGNNVREWKGRFFMKKYNGLESELGIF